jgi:hypothetical protein
MRVLLLGPVGWTYTLTECRGAAADTRLASSNIVTILLEQNHRVIDFGDIGMEDALDGVWFALHRRGIG